MRAKIENKILVTALNLNFALTVVLLLGLMLNHLTPDTNCGDNPMCGVDIVTPFLIWITSTALILRNLWKLLNNLFLASVCVMAMVGIGAASSSFAKLLGFEIIGLALPLALPLIVMVAHAASFWRGKIESYNLLRDLIALALAPILFLLPYFAVSELEHRIKARKHPQTQNDASTRDGQSSDHRREVVINN
jgi:hypothetical protein